MAAVQSQQSWKPVKIPHLPKLPKELSRTSPVELERNICEVYLRFCRKNKECGITIDDISGPDSIHHAYENVIRKQVEDFCVAAYKKMRVAKQIVVTPGVSDKQGLEVLQKAAQGIEDAKRVEMAYNVARKLWECVRKRVLGLVAEQQAREELLSNISDGNVGQMEHVLSSDFAGREIIHTSLPCDAPQIADRAPRFGVYEPLPKDSLGPLPDYPVLPTSKADELYLATRKLCQHGQLCVCQLLRFPQLMLQERIALDKAMPGPERIERIMAFNRVVRVWSYSFANDELEAHKRWSCDHDSSVFDRPEGLYVPTEIREQSLLAEPKENLVLKTRPPWTNPGLPSQLKISESEVVMTFDAADSPVQLNGKALRQVVMTFGKDPPPNGVEVTVNINDGATEVTPESPSASIQTDPTEASTVSPSGSSMTSCACPSTPSSASGDPPAETVNADDITVAFPQPIHDSHIEPMIEEEEDQESMCIICLEKPATQVVQVCGHLVYCRACQRKAVGAVLDGVGSEKILTRKKLQQLSNIHLDRTKIPCPVCRAESRCVRKDRFKGLVFVV